MITYLAGHHLLGETPLETGSPRGAPDPPIDLSAALEECPGGAAMCFVRSIPVPIISRKNHGWLPLSSKSPVTEHLRA